MDIGEFEGRARSCCIPICANRSGADAAETTGYNVCMGKEAVHFANRVGDMAADNGRMRKAAIECGWLS